MIRLKLLIILLIFFIYSSKIAQKGETTYDVKSQIWMLKNLNVTTFQNGDVIPQAQSAAEWIDAGRKGIPAWCYAIKVKRPNQKFEPFFQKTPHLDDEKLYNWYAVTDPRQIAPVGYKVADESDWRKFYSYSKKIINKRSSYRTCNLNGRLTINFDGKEILEPEEKKIKVNLNAYQKCFKRNQEYTCITFYSWWLPTESSNFTEQAYIILENGYLETAPYSKAGGFFVRCVKVEN